jgi:hypothetical protein
MKKYFLLTIYLMATTALWSQKQLTREAYIKFYSETPVENIEASTKKASSVINLENGDFVCQVLMKSFHFEKALMQEHFNENYVESEKYPKAVFKGKMLDWNAIDLSKEMDYEYTAKGVMQMHGAEKEVEAECLFQVKGGQLTISTVFKLVPEDFNIEIPSTVRENIAKEIEVTFKGTYNPVK